MSAAVCTRALSLVPLMQMPAIVRIATSAYERARDWRLTSLGVRCSRLFEFLGTGWLLHRHIRSMRSMLIRRVPPLKCKLNFCDILEAELQIRHAPLREFGQWSR